MSEILIDADVLEALARRWEIAAGECERRANLRIGGEYLEPAVEGHTLLQCAEALRRLFARPEDADLATDRQ